MAFKMKPCSPALMTTERYASPLKKAKSKSYAPKRNKKSGNYAEVKKAEVLVKMLEAE